MNVEELYYNGYNFYFGSNGFTKDINKASEFLLAAYEKAEKTHPRYPLICFLLADINRSNSDIAFEYYWKAIACGDKVLPESWKALAWFNVGYIYEKRGSAGILKKANHSVLGDAARCYRESALLGNTSAMINFANLITLHRITPWRAEAEDWAYKALEKGSKQEQSLAKMILKRIRDWKYS